MGAFNNGKFNRDKFNIKSSDNLSITGTADVNYLAGLQDFLVQKEIENLAAGIAYNSSATGYVEKKLDKSVQAAFDFYAQALATIVVPLEDLSADIAYEAQATSSFLGEEYLEIKGFALKPGQEIEINTCELTATINGQNAIHLLTEDGDFFDFLPGQNEIKIDAIGAGSVSVDTYWKDRWL